MEIMAEAHGWLDTAFIAGIFFEIGGIKARLKAVEDWIFNNQPKEKNNGNSYRSF